MTVSPCTASCKRYNSIHGWYLVSTTGASTQGRRPGSLQWANRTFDRLAGAGRAYILLAVAAEHLHELTQAVGAIEPYVDRRIAHYDKRGIGQPMPTFADLTAALETLEKIVIFYGQFLKRPAMPTMLPTLQFDWQEIFRFPWSPLPHDSSREVS